MTAIWPMLSAPFSATWAVYMHSTESLAGISTASTPYGQSPETRTSLCMITLTSVRQRQCFKTADVANIRLIG